MLQADNHSFSESLDIALLDVPPRSRLCSLEPVGIGTPYTESLTGFIARLAETHNVSTAVLFGYELAPLACKEYLRRAAIRSKYQCRLLGSAFRPLARAMNGTGAGASEWVQILQTLTMRTDLRFLTMLSWKEVLPHGQLLHPTRAWCPACYQEWHKRGMKIYEPLLWAIKSVTVCPRHGTGLRTICHHCQKSSCPLASHSRPGYCSICGMWLGRALNIESSSEAEPAIEELKMQLWAAKAVSELLAAAPYLGTLPSREGILKYASGYLKGYKGNLPDLARFLRVNKASLWHWYKGEHLIQLPSLLRLCYQLGVSPLDFITGKIIIKCSVAVPTLPTRNEIDAKQPTLKRRALNKTEANQVLQAAMREMPPPRLQDVAARLDRDANTLRYWFEDLCKEIVARYAKYKRALSTKGWKNIECILQKILKEEKPPSMAEVARRLGYDIKTLTKHYSNLCKEISARHTQYGKIYREEIQAKLQVMLGEYPPPSVLKAAARLGLSKSSLYKHFPTLCHQIASRYVSFRSSFRKELSRA